MKRTSGTQEKLTGEKLARAIEQYNQGGTLKEVAAATGASRTAVARSLRKAGVVLRSKGFETAAQSKARGKVPPLEGFNPVMGRMASVSLRVGA